MPRPLFDQSEGLEISSPAVTIFQIRSDQVSRSVVSDSLRPRGLYSPWNSPGQNTGVGSLSLLQGIFPTQGWNPSLPHCRQILYQLSQADSLPTELSGKPRITEEALKILMWGDSSGDSGEKLSHV